MDAPQAPLSTGFPRQEYWSVLPFPSPEDRPDPGLKPKALESPDLAGKFFTAEPPGKPLSTDTNNKNEPQGKIRSSPLLSLNVWKTSPAFSNSKKWATSGGKKRWKKAKKGGKRKRVWRSKAEGCCVLLESLPLYHLYIFLTSFLCRFWFTEQGNCTIAF